MMEQDKGVWAWVVVELTEHEDFLGCIDVYLSESEAQNKARNLNMDPYPGASVCRVMKARFRAEQEEK